MNKNKIKSEEGKIQLSSLIESSQQATTKEGSGRTSIALASHIAAPKNQSVADSVQLELKGKSISLEPREAKLSNILNRSLNVYDPDVAEYIKWTERVENYGLEEAGTHPNQISRTYSLKELTKRMYKNRARKCEIERVWESLEKLSQTKQVMVLGNRGIKVKASIISLDFSIEDTSPEERGLDTVRIVFGTVFLWNLRNRFSYWSPKIDDIWLARGSGTEGNLFTALIYLLHSVCCIRQGKAIEARQKLWNRINKKHKNLSIEEKRELYKRMEGEAVDKELVYKESVSYFKSRISNTDYDSNKQLNYNFTQDFKKAVGAAKEIGIITYGNIHKGIGQKGQDMVVFKFSETYKDSKELPLNPQQPPSE